MKSAEEIRKSKQAKLQERLKENTERINMELVEIEKAQNKWESDLDDNKLYFEIPILIKTKEVKTLLAEQGYIIDRVSNDIKVNTSRIYVDKEAYNIAIKRNNKYFQDDKINLNKSVYNESNIINTHNNSQNKEKIKSEDDYKEKDLQDLLNNIMIYNILNNKRQGRC